MLKSKFRLSGFIAAFFFMASLCGIFAWQSKLALDGLDRWVGRDDHRLPNIRQVPKHCRWAVIDRFIELQPLQNADAIVFGDSQIYARGATQEEIFYTHWLGEDAVVINFSFLAARIRDTNEIARELKRRNITAKRTLQNVNFTHFVDHDYGYKRNIFGNLPDTRFIPPYPKGLKKVIYSKPICAFQMRKIFTEDKLRTPLYRKLGDKFRKVSLRATYTDFDPAIFERKIDQDSDQFIGLASQTIFIANPFAYDKFEVYGFDENNLDVFAESFQTFCDKYAPQLTCLNKSKLITHEGFTDLIHMNARGHEALGMSLRGDMP